MKGLAKIIIGLICIIVMVIFTYIGYRIPTLLGFNPSKLLGVIGFIIGLRISIKLSRYT